MICVTDAFVSHVEEDQELALQIANGLEEAGYKTWYYERDSLPGPPYLTQVGEAIEQSCAMLLIVSPDSLESNQVTNEVVRAYESGKPFIPVLHNVTHAELHKRQPVWRQCLGASASVAITQETIAAVVPRLIEGLKALGVDSRISVAAIPRPCVKKSEPEGHITTAFELATAPDRFRVKTQVLRKLKAALVAQLEKGTVCEVRKTVAQIMKIKPCDEDAIRAFDRTNKTVSTALLLPILAASCSTDGTWAAYGGADCTVVLVDMETGFAHTPFAGHTEAVRSLAFSPDSKMILSGGATRDSDICLWDITAGRIIRRFEGHTKSVRSLAFAPDGKRFVSGSTDGTVRLWDVTGNIKEPRIFDKDLDKVYAVSFSPDGHWLFAGDDAGGLHLWDAETGRTESMLQEPMGEIRCIALSPDGRYAVSGSRKSFIRLWDLEKKRQVRRFEGHSDGVTSVAFSPYGSCIASGSLDGSVRVWDVDSGIEINSFKGHMGRVQAVSFLPDGQRLLSGSWDGTLRLWILG